MIDYGTAEEHLVCKQENNKDILAIIPENCIKAVNDDYTICSGAINQNLCTGCLACQIGIATPQDGVNYLGIPCDLPIYTYDCLKKNIFNGQYQTFPSNKSEVRVLTRRFNQYTKSNETKRTNPLIGCYLWSMSNGKRALSCSPHHELALDVGLIQGKREGHLDVTLRNKNEKKYLFVAEGKRDITSFLGDSTREQQKKYEKRIKEIGNSFDHQSLFSYVIGGPEEPLYPQKTENLPFHAKRKTFFHDVERNEKRYISIHALRGLGVLYISSKGKLSIEKTIFELFKNNEVIGLVQGGPIVNQRGKISIQNIRDFIHID